jgi:hypothetical protein
MLRISCTAAAAAPVCAACGGSAGVRPTSCDDTVLSACVVSKTQPYDRRYVERALGQALDYWNAPPETLAGWAIVFEPGEVECTSGPASGCTHWDADVRTIEVQVLDPACVETAQLVHELGHVLHEDPAHTGPLWSWRREQDATYAMVRTPGSSPACGRSLFYTVDP